MKVWLSQGRFWIDGKEVESVKFKDGESKKFGEENDNDFASVSVDAMPGNVSVTQVKNFISPGSVINCGGSLHIGDTK